MVKRTAYLLLILGVLACSEEYFPPGIYGYQVERLLTGGASKIWLAEQLVVDGEQQAFESCTDSMSLYFARVGSANNDSLVCYELRPKANCGLYDSIYYGRFSGSGGTEPFRDSIIFQGGAVNFAIVDQVNSQELALRYRLYGQDIRARFRSGGAASGQPTAQQLEIFLAGGVDDGSERIFDIRTLHLNNELQELTSCQDSIRVLFQQDNGELRAFEQKPLADCQDFHTTFYGNVRLSLDDEGRFTDTLFFTGGQLDAVLFDFVSASSFSMRYRRDTLAYRLTFRAQPE